MSVTVVSCRDGAEHHRGMTCTALDDVEDVWTDRVQSSVQRPVMGEAAPTPTQPGLLTGEKPPLSPQPAILTRRAVLAVHEM